jgi:hypothetical protein
LIGHDVHLYLQATRQWLATSQFYPAHELAGPFDVQEREILYPPIALILFVPFTILPELLWWGIPILTTAAVIVFWRPRPWARVGIMLLLVLPITSFNYSASLDLVLNGNPVLWVVAFVALATRFPFFGPLGLVKPIPLLFPFVLIGVRSRTWWAGLATIVIVAIPFASMWLDYARVLLNARGNGVAYGASSVFPALIPVIAWLGSGRSDGIHLAVRATRAPLGGP